MGFELHHSNLCLLSHGLIPSMCVSIQPPFFSYEDRSLDLGTPPPTLSRPHF